MERLGPINLRRVQWVAADQGIDPADLGAYADLPADAWQKATQTARLRIANDPQITADPARISHDFGRK